MEDGTEAAEPVGFCRQDVFQDYRRWCLQLCPDVQPCRDHRLLNKAAQYLRQADLRETFTVFPFLQVVTKAGGEPNPDRRRQLAAFIRASEMLETICVNLVLQPWKREIRTLKTFTGPFVYRLLPVLSSATIQSVLASIGYLPQDNGSQSEFRLGTDVSSDRIMLVGFELLLARLECYRLLDVLVEDQLTQHEWLELLQRRERPTKPVGGTEKKTAPGPPEDQEDKTKTQEPPSLERRPALNLQSKPRCHRFTSVDQSIMEMQRTYPDLAFRGRLLVPDQPHKAPTNLLCNAGKDWIRESKAAALANRDQGAGADEVLAGTDRAAGDTDPSSRGDPAPTDTASDGRTVDEELSGPRAISLHRTLRAGTEAEPGVTPGKPPSAAQTQQHSDRKHERVSLSPLDEEQEQKERDGRMEQLFPDIRDKRREDDERGEEDMSTEMMQEEKKRSSEKRRKCQDGGVGTCSDDAGGN